MRALIIIGALVSLCVSNNVGTRLLPLPAAAQAYAGHLSPNPAASNLPASSKTAAFRVAIAAPAQKRAGAERQPLSVAAHTPKGVSTGPAEARIFKRPVYTPLQSTSAYAAQPPGRAPPCSV
ncbi:MAG TPA: hypothetical protein VJS44_02325 [Pyrinomonadaceae bacterium]|nr:hypothetical protein [Pyrinomonadaceae bacterium]